jgi:hypothetical protein
VIAVTGEGEFFVRAVVFLQRIHIAATLL